MSAKVFPAVEKSTVGVQLAEGDALPKRGRKLLYVSLSVALVIMAIPMSYKVWWELERVAAIDALVAVGARLSFSDRSVFISSSSAPKWLKLSLQNVDQIYLSTEGRGVDVEIIHKIRFLTSVRELELRHIFDLQVLNKVLPHLWQLEKLTLSEAAASGIVRMTKIVDRQTDRSTISSLIGRKSFQYLDLDSIELSAVDIQAIREIVSLKVLQIRGCGFEVDDLRYLCDHPGLSSISFFRSHFDDRGLESISQLPQLEVFCVSETRVTAAGLSQLTGSTTLNCLSASQIPATRELLEKFVSCHNLERVEFDWRQMEDSDYSIMPQFRRLKSLSLKPSRIGDEGLAHISRVSSLEELTVWSPFYTDRVANDLLQLTNLRVLRLLKSQKVTDAMAEKMSQLPNLEQIQIEAGQAKQWKWPKYWQLIKKGQGMRLH